MNSIRPFPNDQTLAIHCTVDQLVLEHDTPSTAARGPVECWSPHVTPSLRNTKHTPLSFSFLFAHSGSGFIGPTMLPVLKGLCNVLLLAFTLLRTRKNNHFDVFFSIALCLFFKLFSGVTSTTGTAHLGSLFMSGGVSIGRTV